MNNKILTYRSLLLSLVILAVTGCCHRCISGSVINEQGNPVPYAKVTVSGLSPGGLIGDKMVANTVETDVNGLFCVKAPASSHFLHASSPDKKLTADAIFPVYEQGNIIVVKEKTSNQSTHYPTASGDSE